MFDFFKMAFAIAAAAAIGYFLYQVLNYISIYIMGFIGIMTGVFLIIKWAMISVLVVFLPIYIAGIVFAWLYNILIK